MNGISEAIDIFKERRMFYKSVDLKVAAVRYQDSWYNIRTKILLLPTGASIIREKMVDVEDFMIIHKTLESNDFVKLLQDIEMDNLEIDDVKINFFTTTKPPLMPQDYCRGDSLKAKERWNIDWPVDLYEWSQSHKLQNELQTIFREIDMRLRRFDPPYKNVEDAIIDLLSLPIYHFQEYYSQDSKCYVLLPNFVAMEGVELKGSNLEINVCFHKSVDIKDLLLSVISYGRKTRRFRKNLKGREIETSPPFKRVRKSFRINDAADVQLYLFSKQMKKYGHCDQRSPRNVKLALNPRIASHEAFDEGSARLLQLLRGKAKNRPPRSFEYAVATLLHMCGFRTEWLGYAGIVEEAPDILAFCSEPELIIVGECTTEIPDVNKYKNIKERSEQLQNHFRTKTCAVMFSSTEVPNNEQPEAFKYSVSVVGSEKLKELYDMAARNKPIREMLNILTGRVW